MFLESKEKPNRENLANERASVYIIKGFHLTLRFKDLMTGMLITLLCSLQEQI